MLGPRGLGAPAQHQKSLRQDLEIYVGGACLAASGPAQHQKSLRQDLEIYVWGGGLGRSEEHTSELQSLMRISSDVFCFKKKTNTQSNLHRTSHSPHEQAH